jgi:hypothetical protein
VFYKLARLGASEPGQPVKPLTTKWSQYHFLLTDLPVTGLTELRVGFDLMGEGEAWMDDVQVYDLWFDPDKEQRELLKSTFTADEQLASGQLGECWRFVEGYWPAFLRRHVALGSRRTRG